MKFSAYAAAISDDRGFFPTSRLRRLIRKNDRPTAREEAIAAEVLQQANPRENITGRHPWDAEETIVLQQLWIHTEREELEWRDVPIDNGSEFFTVAQTESGELPVPNAIREPGQIVGDFEQRLREALGQTNFKNPAEE